MSSEANPDRIRLLLVEDDPAEAAHVRAMLAGERLARVDVTWVAGADAALAEMAAALPDVVLLDLGLRDATADALVAIAQHGPAVPVIVLSGVDDEAAALRAVQQGAEDYLVRDQLNGHMLARVVRYAVERHRAHAALDAERGLLATLLENLPDRVYFKDLHSRFLRASRSIADLFHLAHPAALVGKTDLDFFAAAHAQPAYADEQLVIATGRALVGKVEREALPDGRTFWVTTTKFPLRDATGRIVGTFGLSRDITPLKRLEEALGAERSLLRNLINALPDQIYVKDTACRFVLANTAVLRFFGVGSEAELLGKTDADFFPPETATFFRVEEEQVLGGGDPMPNREALIRGPGGAEQWVITSKVPLRDGDGQIIGTVGINRDITERKVAEERTRAALDESRASHEQLQSMQLQMIEGEKLKSVGRLAAGIAHEVKNPLAVVGLGIDYLTARPPGGATGSGGEPDANLANVLRNMKEAVHRADVVVRGLLDFASPRRLDLARVDINALLERGLVLVRHELSRAHVRVVRELADGLPPVLLDRNKMEQVAINALTNAAHAMPKGGTLTLRTYASTCAEAGLPPAADGGSAASPVVGIELDDTGHGIAPEQLSKVFEPFFTTKAAGSGTGLGLTVSKTIVELHGGSIEMRNRPEGGVRLRVTLRA